MRSSVDVTQAGLELAEPESLPKKGFFFTLNRAMQILNRALMIPCMIALVLAAGILSYSVAARYFLKIPTEWQDETAVFLLVGATFFSSAYVQEFRGHVGIEAVVGLLPHGVNRFRMIVVDAIGFLFCAFFAWKSWTLCHEAYVDGVTSNSTWGPKLWIPYALMSVGMTLLSVQLAVECLTRVFVRNAYPSATRVVHG
jgi:TRAP-type C4-dicarboxylate transport system permease small subunit